MPSRHRALTVALLLIAVVGSRAAVFPASIWEQDEAYLAAAVVELDLARSAPHPPFFPLWVGIGRLLGGLGLGPAAGLQVASACLGSLMVVPLLALWSRLLPVPLAAGATVLGLLAPGVWLLSGRAFSGTAATAFLATALASWTRPEPRRGWIIAGSLAAGAAILVRPQVALAVAGSLVPLLWSAARRDRLALVLPAVGVTVVGFAVFLGAAGPSDAVRAAVARHAAAHFGALPTASRSLFDSGLVAVLGHPVVVLAWCALAVVGVGLAVRSTGHRSAAAATVAALAATVLVVFGLSNPAHPRYAVPLVVLSSGFVVVGLRRLLGGGGAGAVVVVGVTLAAAVVLPSGAVSRQVASPPIRALEYADQVAERRAGVLVVDRTLHAFVVYRDAIGRSVSPVVFDHVLELGAVPAPPAGRAVAVFDDRHVGVLVGADSRRVFSCTDRLLRALAQDRFLDVTVAEGARLTIAAGAQGGVRVPTERARPRPGGIVPRGAAGWVAAIPPSPTRATRSASRASP